MLYYVHALSGNTVLVVGTLAPTTSSPEPYHLLVAFYHLSYQYLY